MIFVTEHVINTKFGGYGISKEAYRFLGLEWDGFGYAFNDDRSNTKLIECVKKLGKLANSECADLKVVKTEIEVYVENEYDGVETIRVYVR